MGYMFSFGDDVGLPELVECYVETQRSQRHPRIAEHLVELRGSFEQALQVRIPEQPQAPNAGVWMLFFGLAKSLAAEEAPLQGVLEGGLIFTQLRSLGLKAVEDELTSLADRRAQLRSDQLALASRLLGVLTRTAPDKRVSVDELQATGIYPGRTPHDFDLLEHI